MAKPTVQPLESLGTIMRAKTKIKDSALEARYRDTVRNNEKLQACCRDVDESDVTLIKTHEDATSADLMVIECDVCGRRQYRTAVGPGRVGG